MPLYGRSRPKNSDDPLVRLKRRRRGRALGQVRERAVGDHVDARRIDAQLARETLAAVLGVDDDRVEAVVQASLGGALPGTGLAREDVVGGQHERAPGTGRGAVGGQQAAVELLDREPLEVHDVGGARGAAVAEHVRDVLGELEQRGAREPGAKRAPR